MPCVPLTPSYYYSKINCGIFLINRKKREKPTSIDSIAFFRRLNSCFAQREIAFNAQEDDEGGRYDLESSVYFILL